MAQIHKRPEGKDVEKEVNIVTFKENEDQYEYKIMGEFTNWMNEGLPLYLALIKSDPNQNMKKELVK